MSFQPINDWLRSESIHGHRTNANDTCLRRLREDLYLIVTGHVRSTTLQEILHNSRRFCENCMMAPVLQHWRRVRAYLHQTKVIRKVIKIKEQRKKIKE